MAREQRSPVVFILLGLLVGGLIGWRLFTRTPPPPAMPVPKVESWELAKTIDINVYVDGSGSIRHFLEGPARKGLQRNFLAELLDKGDTTLQNAPGAGGWQSPAVRFWKFGGVVQELPAVTGLQELSRNPGAFNAPTTRIETAVNHVASAPNEQRAPGLRRPELKIIITDLYQSGGVIAFPANALAAKYLNNQTDPLLANDGGAVGVLMVRNVFDGDVEDLPGTPGGRSLKDAAYTMPFYILFAGAAPDVLHGMETIVQGIGLEDELKKRSAVELFFTRKPAAQSEELPDLEGRGSRLREKNYLGSHIPVVELKKGTLRADWSQARSGTAGGAGLAAAGSPTLGTNLVLKASALRLMRGGEAAADDQAALAATPCGDPQAACESIDRSSLATGAWYRFEFAQTSNSPAPVFNDSGALLKDWNIEVPDAERISTSPSPHFPDDPVLGERAGKTPRLSEFLKALQGQMFHAPVKMASYYLYLQAK